MTELLWRMTEERYGIKADRDDIEKLKNHLLSLGIDNETSIENFFNSGEAAAFLTVNETYFFREPVHFYLLKEMLSFANRPNRSVIRICCAASSYGCEAYSIAMLLDMLDKNEQTRQNYTIDAFDINPFVIETACKGIFRQNSLREDGSCFGYLTDHYLKKEDVSYHVGQNLKNNINFFVHNLLNELNCEYYDFIFFRNAFIYIMPECREKVLSNLCNALKENGILIMGVSETSAVSHLMLEQKIIRLNTPKEEVFFFQKKNQKPYLGEKG
ncbi:MAG: hypothetical protein FWC01_00705 [Treponema sp.]|nr:hypothetical protein [Treponema sp.]MCL2237208.1 hypothetical protein [Treponema sp.]